ncbi:hypothetical protein [Aestuariivita boseongensis]|uniref:hypothetical protein n=1 Tax=Aestuariivita boseongensis TaxID=1470562 RepID=UPI000680DACD|nr:hypothetical protein [Aestuariivita boseongensis]
MKFVICGGRFDEYVDIYTETEEELSELIAKYQNLGHEVIEEDAFFLEPTIKIFRNYCESIVSDAPEKVNDDGSEAAFASEVLKYFREMQRCIESSDAESAAHFAFYAGWKLEQMRLKFSYEKVAETGAKTHKYLDNIRTTRNTAAKANMDKRRDALASLMKETRLTGGALDAWLKRRLEEQFGICVSKRTIRGDRKALKTS